MISVRWCHRGEELACQRPKDFQQVGDCRAEDCLREERRFDSRARLSNFHFASSFFSCPGFAGLVFARNCPADFASAMPASFRSPIRQECRREALRPSEPAFSYWTSVVRIDGHFELAKLGIT